MRLVLALLFSLPATGLAVAQTGGGTMTPIQRCEQNHQTCIRDCSGVNSQACMANCAAMRAQCIQNPSTATQPRR
jgi:hypothetical protein